MESRGRSAEARSRRAGIGIVGRPVCGEPAAHPIHLQHCRSDLPHRRSRLPRAECPRVAHRLPADSSRTGSVPSVAIFAFSAAAATYLLIRASRHAYNRTLVNLFDHEADSVIDALAAVLIASALVWQFGMIENLSRGIAILFLLAFCALLARLASHRPRRCSAPRRQRLDRTAYRLLRRRP